MAGSDAEDIVQETFLRFLRDGPPIGSEEARRWLFRVARNLGLKAIRGTQRRRQREIQTFEPQMEPSPFNAAASRDDHAKIEICLGQLEQDVRELVYLKIVEQKSFQELSELTGMPRSTVAWKVQDGLVRLKRLFHGK